MNVPDDDRPNFDGQTVVFYNGDMEHIGVIASPRFEVQGGRLFVVGYAATSPGHWARDGRVAVAWDVVASYVALGSDEYASRRAVEDEKKPARSFWGRK